MTQIVTPAPGRRTVEERAERFLEIYRAECALRGLPPDTSSAMEAMEATGVAAVAEASGLWTP